MTTRPGFFDNEAQTAYTVLGFEQITTGGNCTAFFKPVSEGRHILITVVDDAQAPTKADEDVTVGLYGEEHSEPLDQFQAAGAEEVQQVLAAKGWK